MISKCVKCNNTLFELVENTPNNSNYKMFFVQCSACGSVVNAMEYFSSGAKIAELEKKIDLYQRNMEHRLNIIENAIIEIGRRLK